MKLSGANWLMLTTLKVEMLNLNTEIFFTGLFRELEKDSISVQIPLRLKCYFKIRPLIFAKKILKTFLIYQTLCTAVTFNHES